MTETANGDGAGRPGTRQFTYMILGLLLLAILAVSARPLMGWIGAYLAERAVQKTERLLEQRDQEALEYARAYIAVEDVTLQWFEDIVHARTVALRGRLTNNGNRAVESLLIRVRFLDGRGETMGEDEAVVFVSGGFSTLEPPLMPGDGHEFAMSLSEAPRDWYEGHGAEWTISSARFFTPKNQSPTFR